MAVFGWFYKHADPTGSTNMPALRASEWRCLAGSTNMPTLRVLQTCRPYGFYKHAGPYGFYKHADPTGL